MIESRSLPRQYSGLAVISSMNRRAIGLGRRVPCFAPVLEASGVPGLLGHNTDGADSVLRLRWFLGYATCLAAAPQYVSAPTISWPFRDPSAHQVWSATELLMNFTEPSQNPTLTPPGWLLVAEIAAPNPPLALE